MAGNAGYSGPNGGACVACAVGEYKFRKVLPPLALQDGVACACACDGVRDGCPLHEAVADLPAERLSQRKQLHGRPCYLAPCVAPPHCPVDTKGHQHPDSYLIKSIHHVIKSIHHLILIARARL